MEKIENVKNKENNKITIDEYIEKYTAPQNIKEVKWLFAVLVFAIGVLIFCNLFSFIERLFALNEIAGYIGIGISVLIFLLLFVYPVIRISTSRHFVTNVNHKNARAARHHNKIVCRDIADKMIDLNVVTNCNCWYSEEKIAPIAIARARKDDKALKIALTDIFNTDVKKAANNMIRDASLQVGLITSISQSEKVDTLIVTVSDINIIKKLVYLYGYRPNDAQMLKIYKRVLSNALLAYGVQSATSSIAGGIGKLIGGAAKEIPLISTVIGSVTDGTINATLTAIIGFQTIKYLKSEFKLQSILEEVEIEDSEEAEMAMISDIKKEVVSQKR